jgi:hypothetical protein
MKLGADITGLAGLVEELGALADEGSDLREIKQESVSAFANVERAWFESEGDRGWQPLTRGYAQRKERRYGVKGLLRASDALYRALTDPNSIGLHDSHDEIVFEVTGQTGQIGFYHQVGTRYMPARPPLAPEEKFDKLAEILTEHLEAISRKHNLPMS